MISFVGTDPGYRSWWVAKRYRVDRSGYLFQAECSRCIFQLYDRFCVCLNHIPHDGTPELISLARTVAQPFSGRRPLSIHLARVAPKNFQLDPVDFTPLSE